MNFTCKCVYVVTPDVVGSAVIAKGLLAIFDMIEMPQVSRIFVISPEMITHEIHAHVRA